MNKKIIDWQESIEALQLEGKSLVEKMDAGIITDVEQARAKAIVKEKANIEDLIQKELVKLELQKSIDKSASKVEPEVKAYGSYSISKAIKEFTEKGRLSGLEAEMDQEARKNNPKITNIGIPHLDVKTTLTSGTAATAGNAVATDLSDEMIRALNPQPLIERMGARFLRGLTSNLDILKFTSEGAGSAWEGEVDAGSESNPTTTKLTFTPNRHGAWTKISKTLLAQQNKISDALIAGFIRTETEKALDSQAFNGSGSPFTGVLGLTDAGTVAGGTDGAVPTWGNIVDLETQIRVDDVTAQSLAFVTTPQIVGLLKTVKKDAGSGIFVIENGQANGFQVYSSTLMPSTLVKGASGAVCHAIILGDWSQLYVGQFGLGYDIVVDPYSSSKNAAIDVVVNSWWDMHFMHEEAFASMDDAKLS